MRGVICDIVQIPQLLLRYTFKDWAGKALRESSFNVIYGILIVGILDTR